MGEEQLAALRCPLSDAQRTSALGRGDTDWWPNLPGSAWALASLQTPVLSINDSLCCSLGPVRGSWTARQCPERAAPSLTTSSSGLTGEALLVLLGTSFRVSSHPPTPRAGCLLKSPPHRPPESEFRPCHLVGTLNQTTEKSPSRTGFFHF